MTKVQGTLEPALNNTGNLILECMEKINQALETDCTKKKEMADLESREIVARAKEEAEKTVAEAREEAMVVNRNGSLPAQKFKPKILEKSREEAAEIQQESFRVLNEAREKASQFATEIIKKITMQAQSELARVASEATSQTTQLLTQVSNNVEQIIGETEKNIEGELGILSNVIAEAENKLETSDETEEVEEDEVVAEEAEIATSEAVEETPEPVISENNKAEPENTSDKENASTAVSENDDVKVFKGNLRLEITLPYYQERLEGMPAWLAKVDGLKVVSTDYHVRANRWVALLDIHLEKPAPLLKIFKTASQIKEFSENKGRIAITLR
jgi:vacuolar-type H+-ATPase subunit H